MKNSKSIKLKFLNVYFRSMPLYILFGILITLLLGVAFLYLIFSNFKGLLSELNYYTFLFFILAIVTLSFMYIGLKKLFNLYNYFSDIENLHKYLKLARRKSIMNRYGGLIFTLIFFLGIGIWYYLEKSFGKIGLLPIGWYFLVSFTAILYIIYIIFKRKGYILG